MEGGVCVCVCVCGGSGGGGGGGSSGLNIPTAGANPSTGLILLHNTTKF